jgi:hypothetical protein
MKKILLYSSLFIFLISCGNDSNNDENRNEVVTAVPEKSVSENTPKDNIVPSPTPNSNCTPSTLEVYLNDPDESGTNIRQSPGGKVVMQLVKGDIDDEFFIKLTQADKGWFKIKSPIGGMEEDVEIPNGEGWIHGSVIGVDTRNYGGQTLELLDSPINGNVVGEIKEQVYGLKLKDICGRWVQVDYKGIVGWIDSNWLCGNPLTTCS